MWLSHSHSTQRLSLQFLTMWLHLQRRRLQLSLLQLPGPVTRLRLLLPHRRGALPLLRRLPQRWPRRPRLM